LSLCSGQSWLKQSGGPQSSLTSEQSDATDVPMASRPEIGTILLLLLFFQVAHSRMDEAIHPMLDERLHNSCAPHSI